MYNYRLIEFTSSKRLEQIRTNKVNLTDILYEFYGKKIALMFNDNGESRGYISIFINSKQVASIKNINLSPNDEVCIVTSISGG